MARMRQIAGTLEDSAREMTATDLQLIALKLASPHRAPAGSILRDQADAAHLPLFVAGNEPSFL